MSTEIIGAPTVDGAGPDWRNWQDLSVSLGYPEGSLLATKDDNGIVTLHFGVQDPVNLVDLGGSNLPPALWPRAASGDGFAAVSLPVLMDDRSSAGALTISADGIFQSPEILGATHTLIASYKA